MERYLTNETEIKLKGIDGHYVIKDIIGRGSSCVVYSADFYNVNGEKTEHLLKEFNPRCIDLVRIDGKLTPLKNEDKDSFDMLCNRFKDGFELQSKLRTVSELKNYTANIQNVYYDNGTIYIDMTETNGKSYADVEEQSIYNLAQRIRVLAQVIGNYHKHGYLHLDIKPSNIFVRPKDETCQDVLLFDFDSLVPFSVENGKCVIGENVLVSYTTEYAPIELLTASRRGRICKATDIYEIGEIFFEKLMGRHSTALEHNVWSDYEYDRSAQIFENVNPKVISLLNELFAHTLCNDVNMRYQSIDELIECLEKIIVLSTPEKFYLKTSLPNISGFFTGRDAEIEEIHRRLQENNVLFLSGIGGIGKSELAKHYAKAHKDSYDAIIFAPFVHDIKMMIADDRYVPIYNFYQYPEEKPDEYFERKMQKLGELCDKRTLLIVDNLDEAEDENIGRLLSVSCKILITTRMDFSDIYSDSQINIAELTNPFDVFKEHYKKPLSTEEQKCVEEIIEIVCGHTMTIELLAKQMMAGRVKPEKMLEKLKNGGISESGKEKVRIAKDGDFSPHNTYEHIQALFDLSEIDEDEKYVLANLSLIPHTGISAELFCEWCEIEDFDVINNLAIEGWIRWDKEKDYISLHPIIGYICQMSCLKISLVSTMFDAIYTFLLNTEFFETEEIGIYTPIFLCIVKVISVNKLDSKQISRLYHYIGKFFVQNTSYIEFAENIIEKGLEWDIQNGIDGESLRLSISYYLSMLATNKAFFGNKNQREERINNWRKIYQTNCSFQIDHSEMTFENRISILSSAATHFSNISDNYNSQIYYQQITDAFEELTNSSVNALLLSENGFDAICDVACAYEALGSINKATDLYYRIINSTNAPKYAAEIAYLGIICTKIDSEDWDGGLIICDKYYRFLNACYKSEHKGFLMYYQARFCFLVNSFLAHVLDDYKSILPSQVLEIIDAFWEYKKFNDQYCGELTTIDIHLVGGYAHFVCGYVLFYLEITAADYGGQETWPEMNYQIAAELLTKAKELYEISGLNEESNIEHYIQIIKDRTE